MATRRISTDYQAAGFGGLSFVTNNNFANLQMSYEQRLWSLESNYCFFLAKNEESKEYKNDERVKSLMKELRKLLDQAGEDYRADYENHASFSDGENKYRLLLCQCFERITQLQGLTKMIEKQIMKMEEIG